jgi:transposase-like protein
MNNNTRSLKPIENPSININEIANFKKIANKTFYSVKKSYSKSSLISKNVVNLNFNVHLIRDKIIHDVSNFRFSDGLICPFCNGKRTILYGHYSGKQRYKCNCCSKTFNVLTNTPFMMTHYPEKWLDFIDCMVKGLSLRKSAKILDVSYVTLFYWRHKLLSSLKQIKTEKLEGIIEADEMYLFNSQKGKRNIYSRFRRNRGYSMFYTVPLKEQLCVLFAKDRYRNTFCEIACLGRLNRIDLEAMIGNYINEKTILCTDNWGAYINFARLRKIKRYEFSNYNNKIDQAYNIVSVKEYIQNFHTWFKRFKGVANKYLNNYLYWFKFLENMSLRISSLQIIEMFKFACLKSVKETYSSLRMLEFTI